MNLCQETFWKKLKDVNSIIHLNGPASACFRTKYCFECELRVDGESYCVEMYTLPDKVIKHQIILGRLLFQTNAKLRVSPQTVTIIHANTT